MNDAKVEVRIQFKDVTSGIFKDVARNELVLRIQPSESVYLKLNTKTPGLYTRAMPTEMDLTYKRRFVDNKIPEAYEALILDALKGNHSNFVRQDELDHAWKVSVALPRKKIPPRTAVVTRCSTSMFRGILDLHAHLTLDRGEGWATPQAVAVPLWFTRSKGYRRVRSQVRLHPVFRGIVSLRFFGLSSPRLTYCPRVHVARGQLQPWPTWPTCDVSVDVVGYGPSCEKKLRD
jgi:Glucose-6-phosphate dehydrogenase, C-terminal domain